MKTLTICESEIARNHSYNVEGRPVSFPSTEILIKAGQEGRLFVVYSSGPWCETVRVVANSSGEAVAAVAANHDGSEWIHKCVGTIKVVPDPEWWAEWVDLVGHLGGIENLDARIGACLSQGTTAEQAWLGRALRAMGERGKEIVTEAQANLGSRSSTWCSETAAELEPYCDPADHVLTERRSELEPSAFGQLASVAPLCGVAEGIARAQVKAGTAIPFPACNPGGWKVVWVTSSGGRLVTIGNLLFPAPTGLAENVLEDDYETFLITRDVEEFGIEWARRYRADSFA